MQDWDILYLNGCLVKTGKQLNEHVVVLRSACCPLGFVATPKFAKHILSDLRKANRLGVTPVYDIMYAVSKLTRCGGVTSRLSSWLVA